MTANKQSANALTQDLLHHATYYEIWVKHPQRQTWTLYGPFLRANVACDRLAELRAEYRDLEGARVIERHTSIVLPIAASAQLPGQGSK